MSGTDEVFFTRIGCMDGRAQKAVSEFGQKRFNAQYPDTITDPGLVGLLTKEEVDKDFFERLRREIFISVEKHHSKGIVVYGHQDCAGYPVSDDVQRESIKKSIVLIKSLLGSGTPVLGVFVKKGEKGWEIAEVQ